MVGTLLAAPHGMRNPWPKICFRCGACHTPECPLGGGHLSDCIGLHACVVLEGVVYCRECWGALQSEETQTAPRRPQPDDEGLYKETEKFVTRGEDAAS